jgi:RNA polymerase sigma-70 factor (ECF subfamily)
LFAVIFADPCSHIGPDSPLLERARAGDPAAVSELLAPHLETVRRLAYRTALRQDDAEDLAQEAFLRILRTLPAFRGECALRSWIYRIALNVCLTARSRPRPATLDSDDYATPDPAPGPEGIAMSRVLGDRIVEEVRRLPAGCREAVTLRLLEDLPYEEVAEVLGIPVNAARQRIHRGMKQLRARLQPWMEEER